MRVLVTGGAGFVGSHLVAALLDRGDEVVVVDDLSTGHRDAVLPGARLVEADLRDAAALDDLLADGPWDAVFHFASLSQVGDSMRRPMHYIATNVATGLAAIEACVRHGVRKFVLSSTAALFGRAQGATIDEDEAIVPESPYGESKWVLERALMWADRIHGLRSACLRYFNAAGSDLRGRLGEHHDPETHLIPLAIDAALGRRPPLSVFGQDYPTRDGTCVRDYVHVADLADAHLRVLPLLERTSVRFNLGNGLGNSVLEVLSSVERVGGIAVPWIPAERRAGDPAALVASARRIAEAAGWRPAIAELDRIVASAMAWREAHPHGYGKASDTLRRVGAHAS